MPDDVPTLLGALESEGFFGRAGETRRFRTQTRCLLRGSGRSFTLTSHPGAGKTELLKQWHGSLFREGEILPFFHAFPRLRLDQRIAATDFLRRFAAQGLAFRRRDPGLLVRFPPAEALLEGLRAAWGSGGALVAEALRSVEGLPPGHPALAEAAVVPHRFAQLTGARVFCLLDDLGSLAGYAPDAGSGWPAEAVSSRFAPIVFTAADEAVLDRLLGPERETAATAWRLDPLSEEAAGQLLQHLLRTAGIELPGESRDLAVRLCGGSPFALQALVRALSDRPARGSFEVVRAYASTVSDGEIARSWGGRLASAMPDRRVRSAAVELLAYASREGGAGLEKARLGGLMFKPEREIAEAIEGLERAGLLRSAGARVAVDSNPVLADVVAALYRREFGGATPESVAAALAAEKVRLGGADAFRGGRERLRAVLREVLDAWRGQRVPAVFFNAAAWARRFPATPGEPGAAGFPAEEPTVTLPTVVAVASGRVGQAASPGGLEVDGVAWARRGEPGAPSEEVVWVARCLRGGEGSEGEIAAFDAAVSALQAAGDLPAARLVRWAILDAPLDAAGEAAAARLRLSTSGLAQIAALAAMLGVPAVLPAPAAAAAAPPELELEMTIPPAADAELVAARALEQLAENLQLGPEEIGRVKMALVEACINAFEHSGVRGGRVRLLFSVGGGDLRIRVENRGRPLGALPPAAGGEPQGGSGLRKRGWGLTLIRELMDEVALEPREDGVSLLMVKHLGTEEREHA